MKSLKHPARSGAEVSSAEILHDNLDDQEQVIVPCPGGFSGSIDLTCQKGMILTEGCLDSDAGVERCFPRANYIVDLCCMYHVDAYSHHVIRRTALGTIAN